VVAVNEDRTSLPQFSLAELLAAFGWIAVACGLGCQYGLQGVIVSLDLVVGLLALARVFKAKQVFGIRIPTLSFLDLGVCAVVCLVWHGLATPSVTYVSPRRAVPAPVKTLPLPSANGSEGDVRRAANGRVSLRDREAKGDNHLVSKDRSAEEVWTEKKLEDY
jgi:hypothetical protein